MTGIPPPGRGSWRGWGPLRSRRQSASTPGEGGEDEDEDIVPIARSLATLAVLPLLTPGAQKLVTFVNLGSTLGKGRRP